MLDLGITTGSNPPVYPVETLEPASFIRPKLLPEDDEEPLAPLHNLDNQFAGCCCPAVRCPAA